MYNSCRCHRAKSTVNPLSRQIIFAAVVTIRHVTGRTLRAISGHAEVTHEPESGQAGLPLPQRFHFRRSPGLPRLQRRLPARLPALDRDRHALPGRRHRRSVEPEASRSSGRRQHNNVIRTILGKAKHGTRVIYIPGNHDSVFRDYDGMVFGNVEIRREAVHETADGRRFLVLHGDEFDSVIKASPLLEALGNRAYAFILRLNRYVNFFRRRFGFPYWSIAAYLKHKVKNAVKYIANFERALADEAKRRGLDGMICGHIHRAEITDIDGVLYCNDGDWVESCTTLTEDFDGRLALLRWTEQQGSRRAHRRTPRALPHRTGRVKIAIVTDAWRPQTNGVVKTLSTTAEQLRALGHDVRVIEPNQFRTFPCPTYPEIRLAWLPYRRLDASCWTTSVPMPFTSRPKARSGTAARRWCLRQRLPFTTSYHTQFPEYVRARVPIPLALSYAHLRRFHGAAARTMVATPTHAATARSARLSQHRALDARRRCRAVQAARQGLPRLAAADRDVRRSRRRGEEHRGVSALDLPGTKVDRRRWPGARRAARRNIRRRSSLATSSAKSLQRMLRRPMCSCFRAAPIRLAWCCSKRWRAACRSRPIRSPDRSTSCSTASRARSTKICARRR